MPLTVDRAHSAPVVGSVTGKKIVAKKERPANSRGETIRECTPLPQIGWTLKTARIARRTPSTIGGRWSTTARASAIPPLKGGNYNAARGINKYGQIVGYSHQQVGRTNLTKVTLCQPSAPNATTGTLIDLGEGSGGSINSKGSLAIYCRDIGPCL